MVTEGESGESVAGEQRNKAAGMQAKVSKVARVRARGSVCEGAKGRGREQARIERASVRARKGVKHRSDKGAR